MRTRRIRQSYRNINRIEEWLKLVKEEVEAQIFLKFQESILKLKEAHSLLVESKQNDFNVKYFNNEK